MALPRGELVEESLVQPEMVGRERELEKLIKHIDGALEGRGSTVFISGEAGIGKTRFVKELETIAKSKNFFVLSSSSLYESLTPYMPFFEALKSGGLESLFAEEVPRVEGAYLVTDTGLLVKEVVREETSLEPNIFASMLTTVDDFIETSFSLLGKAEEESGLNRLSHGEYTILVENGETASLVVVLTGRENEFLINDMRETLAKVQKFCGNALEDWDGDEDSIHGVDRILRNLVISGKYDGVQYGREDPKAKRSLLFENVSLGLMRQAHSKPTLLCIEDLQWSDPSTCALIHYVARITKECGLLIIGTYRPEDLVSEEGKVHHVVEAMQRMDRENLIETMELPRLSSKSTAMLLASLLEESDLGEEFAHRVYQETEGNPLFILELVELMVEDAILGRDNGGWKVVRDLAETDIPSRVQDVISRRLDLLEGDLREVLDIGSVNGEEFTLELLASVLDWDRMQVLKALRSLERRHRLVRPSDERYRFDHVKIKDVLYAEMPTELRMEYHGKIADAIHEQNAEDLDKVAGDLAFHYYRCRNQSKALPHLIKGAEIAREQYANDEAARLLGEALELATPEERGKLFELRADALLASARYDECLESYENALDSVEDKYKVAEIRGKIGKVCEERRDYDGVLNQCSQALNLVRGEGTREEAVALLRIGNAHYFQGDYERSLEYFTRSLEIWENLGDSQGIASALNDIGNVHADRGDYEKALECYEKRVEICKSIGDEKGVAVSINNIGTVYRDRGDYKKALVLIREALSMHERTADWFNVSRTLGNCGEIHWRLGERDSALEYCKKAIDVSEKIDNMGTIACTLIIIGNLHSDSMDWEEALDAYRRSLEINVKVGHRWSQASILNNIGILHCEKGEYEKALESFEEGLRLSEELGDSLLRAELCHGMGEVHLANGDAQEALRFCNMALSLSEQASQKQYIAASHRLFGKIYQSSKQWNESRDNFQESIQIYRSIGERFEQAATHLDFAQMWKARGETSEAVENLRKAMELYETLGLEKRLDNAKDAYENIMAEIVK